MPTIQIALFPLEVFLLPGEKTHLHIFEPRYRQLLADCGQTDTGFGIPFSTKGKIAEIGCFVKIVRQFNEQPDGSADIEIVGQDIIQIKKFLLRYGEKAYPSGEVLLVKNTDIQPVSETLMKALGRYLEKTDQALIPELLSTQLDPFTVGRILDLGNEDKLKLVQAKSQTAAELILMNRIKLKTKIQDQLKSVDGEFFLN